MNELFIFLLGLIFGAICQHNLFIKKLNYTEKQGRLLKEAIDRVLSDEAVITNEVVEAYNRNRSNQNGG